MDKQQIISFIESQISQGRITQNDLMGLAQGLPVSTQVETPSSSSPGESVTTSRNLTHVFYAIGALIVVVGVIVLIAQNWREIGLGGRLLVTLGISLGTYITGIIMRNPEQRVLSQVMFVISTSLAPLGVYVLLSESSIRFTSSVQIMIALALATVYGVAYLVTKRNILVVIVTGFVTWAYYAFVMKVLGTNSYSYDVLQWATMLLGVSYLCFGYGFKSIRAAVDERDEHEKNVIVNLFYNAGTLAVLGVAISMGGIFDLILIALIFATFYGSVFLKNTSMLVIAAFFLMAHIIKLTSKYFVDSIGWPVALIFVGFLVIGVGYMTYSINKKYISSK